MKRFQPPVEPLSPDAPRLLTDESRLYLLESARWALILSIIGFVFSGIMILTGIITIFARDFLSAALGDPGTTVGFVSGFMNIVAGGLYLFPSFKLRTYSHAVPKALNTGSPAELSVALGCVKSVFKFYGLMTVGFIVFYLLVMLVTLLMSFLRI